MKNLTVEEFENLISKDEKICLMDVREQDEFITGHLKNAIFVPLSDFEKVFNSLNISKNSKIAIYCRSGIRSVSAANILENHGFKSLYNLLGGISEWVRLGKEVEK